MIKKEISILCLFALLACGEKDKLHEPKLVVVQPTVCFKYSRIGTSENDTICLAEGLNSDPIVFLNNTIDTNISGPYVQDEITNKIDLNDGVYQIEVHKYTHGYLMFYHERFGVLFAGRIWSSPLKFRLLSVHDSIELEFRELNFKVDSAIVEYSRIK